MNHRLWFAPLVLILTACAGSRGSDLSAAPSGMLGGLPTPGEIVRTASFDDGSQVRFGMEHDTLIPPNKVSPTHGSITTALFRPAEGPPVDPAYAVYTFDLTGYDEEPTLNFSWYSDPDGNSVWLTLANWETGRWEVVAVDPLNVELDSLDPYIDTDGRLIVAMIVTGSEQRWLRWFSIGTAPQPAKPLIFAVFPTSGQPDAPLTLSAQVIGSQPLTYAWDFGGGADPNTESAAQPTVTVGDEGEYNCTLTLSNKYGSVEHEFELHSINPTWNTHLIGDGVDNKFVTMDTTWKDHTFAAAEMEDGRVSVFEFNGVGDPLWNRAYTGLPANRVTKLLISDPEFNESETEIRRSYLACYEETESGPGNAYVLKLAADGEVIWYVSLGQGVPDIEVIDSERIVFLLDKPDLHSRFGVIADGAVAWARDTDQQAEYTEACAGAAGLDEGLFFIGEQLGHLAIAHTSIDGNIDWVYNCPEAGTKVVDAVGLPGTGVVILGELPFAPQNQWYASYMTVRFDGFVLGYTKFKTHPCRPRDLTTYFNIVFMTTGTAIRDISKVYLLDPWGLLYKGFEIQAPGGVSGGLAQLTRYRPPVPGELEPPLQPLESMIFLGAGSSMDTSVYPATLEQGSWQPFPENPILLTLTDVALPQETLTIVPEEVTYTVDSPAGGSDALFMRLENIF